MKRLPAVKIIWLTIILIHCSYQSFAQKKTNFSQLTIGTQYAYTLNQSTFNDYYETPYWLGVELGTNYLHGFIKVRAHFSDIISKTNIPSYTGSHLSIGYDYALQLPLRFKWINGAAIGNAFMTFRSSPLATSNLTESELLLYLHSSIEWKLNNHIGIASGIEWTRIYTHKRIDFVNAKLQLNYYFNNNTILKKWMD